MLFCPNVAGGLQIRRCQGLAVAPLRRHPWRPSLKPSCICSIGVHYTRLKERTMLYIIEDTINGILMGSIYGLTALG
ncbi:MAG: hypothetical protein P8X55_12650, partial [Desulfosarcinaceae bacterium]